ncbi:hypothetical protein LSH36_253g04000 [Paralvinella palmiformis]|uniref:Armadillo repeat-containing protein 2 n=1 Tax=Paralvinella palmiformis TaxID=53620 RepID=A0AAD9N2P2_9ANNE|nr:hypothetical protein LSH36_253g04000 [Paralvinella palmiformis]
MDKTPPLVHKPKDLPFYKAPENVRTSAQIIQDAKDSLQRGQLRPLSTRRPETPQESQRKLFGEQSIRDPTNRPPSAFSLGSHHFDSESRPVSGTRLSPLDHKPKVVDEIGPIAPKPPADPNRPVRRPGSRQRLHHQHSIDSPTDGSTDRQLRSKSGSLTDVSLVSPTGHIPETTEVPRRVHSGPKERTKHIEDGSAGHREEESPEEALLYNEKIAPIIDEMQRHIKEKDPERLSELSLQFYQALEEANLLGKNCKRRPLILKTVFKLLDLESPKLLLRLARLILALKVSGNNLVNVCKLVFKVSKDEKNDFFFLEGNILDLLIDTLQMPDIMGSAEALVYCIGALKFLSSNDAIARHLVKKDLIEKLARLLSTVNKITSDAGRPSEQIGHILVQDLAVRVCFMLGNLTLRHDESRQKLFEQPETFDTLLLVFKHYCQRDAKIQAADGRNEKSAAQSSSAKVEDVLIKVIRVVANLSINENIGPRLASSGQCVDLLIETLSRKNLQMDEELVLNCMATINNLSYYNVNNSAIKQRQIKLAKCLLKYLDHQHMEGLSEASRIYGNLSREKEIRNFLVKENVDEFMVSLLDSGDREVVFSAVGVLINLMADDEKRETLKVHGGVKKLIDVLRDFSQEDWNLASMVCKTLWNYSGKITSTNACFGEQEGMELAELLTKYLDEDICTDSDLGDLLQFHHNVWETEFYPVATQLLSRIEEHQSNFVPLDQPS